MAHHHDERESRYLDERDVPLETATSVSESDEAKHAVHAIDARGQKPLSEFRRFAILTACVFAMICSSTSYAYNLFSAELQAAYELDFRAVSTINTVGMCFCYFLMPYGFICDYFGPTPVYFIAASLFTLGALLFGLTFQGVIVGSVVKFCVFNAMLSLGAQLFDLSTVTVIMSVFPTRRGWTIAILKTMIGLAQAIIASIRTGFFLGNNNSFYFYFLMGLVVACSAFIIPVVRLPAYHLTGFEEKRLTSEQKQKRMVRRAVYLTQEPPMWRFYFGIAVILVLVVYLPVTSALLAFAKDSIRSDSARIFAIISIIVTCFMFFMMCPFPYLDRLTTKKPKHQLEEEEEAARRGDDGEWVSEAHAVDDGLVLEGDSSAGVKRHEQSSQQPLARPVKEVETDIDYIAPQYQTTFLQSICTLKLWCIFWTMFCGLGCEFVVIYNARYIYGALDEQTPDATVAALLSVLNGAGSALGRLAMSVFEMWSQRRPPEKRIPITAAFFVPTSVIIVSVVLFLVLPGRSLLVAYAIAALGNGFAASITILVLRTLYAKDPAKHYNFSINSLVPASVLINRLLFGEWYAVQCDKLGVTVCTKKRCVLMPMIVMLGLNVTAFASTIYVHFSYMRFCKKVLEERRRIKEEAALGEPYRDDSNDDDLARKPRLGEETVVGEELEENNNSGNQRH